MMGMFGGGGPPAPKGDINQLWKLLGVRMAGDDVIFQDYNPYPRAGGFVDANWLFIDEGNGALNPFNPDEPIASGLRQVLFLLAGSFRATTDTDLEFSQLAVTGDNTGVISHNDLQRAGQTGGSILSQRRTGESYILAARVSGIPRDQDELSLEDLGEGDEADEATEEAEADPADADLEETPEMNVVLVADIDCLADPFFAIREIGDDDEALVAWSFQNVAFVLNALDALAGDDRFIDVRKRTRTHRILEKIELATEEFRDDALKQRSTFVEEAEAEMAAVQEEFARSIAAIEARTDLQAVAKRQMIEQARIRLGRSRDVKIAALEKERDRQIRQSERDLSAQVSSVQDFYKMCAVILPPILPILLAVLVFFHRRESEREGVSKSRLRYGSAESEENAAA